MIRTVFSVLAFSFALTSPSFASQPNGWCHASSVDAPAPHLNFNIHLDYQVNDNGRIYRADPLWINLEQGAASTGDVYVRIVNHTKLKDFETDWTKATYDAQSGKYTAPVPYGVFLGIGRGPEWEIWQTLEIRYGSTSGPGESHNFNLSRNYDENDRGVCYYY